MSELNFLWLVVISLYSIVLCVGLICFLIPILHHYNIVDLPSIRRAHKFPTVRGGGLALILTFLIVLVQAYFIFPHYTIIHFTQLILSVILLGSISFIDDVKGSSILIRLFTHILSSYILLNSFFNSHLLFRGELPRIIDLILTTILLISFLNIYNFLDGIDGISSMQSIHLSICAIILCVLKKDVIVESQYIFYICGIMLGCSVGFLWFNWSPARVFMGDSGSTFLGLIHGLNLILIASGGARLFTAVAICCLYYIADGGLTLFIRMAKGEKFWLPHLNHFFQQAVRKGMTHKEVVFKITQCNLVLMLLSVTALYWPLVAIILALLTITLTLSHFHYAKPQKRTL